MADHRHAVTFILGELVALFPAERQEVVKRALLGPIWDNGMAEMEYAPPADKALAEAALTIFQQIQYPSSVAAEQVLSQSES